MKSRRVAQLTALFLTVALVVTLVLLLALAIPMSTRASSSTQQATSQTGITTAIPNNNTDNTTTNNNTNTGNSNSNTDNNNSNPNPDPNNKNTTAPCPQIHILAARETTAPPPFGTSKVLVDLLLQAFPGAGQATVEAIDYPAAGSTVPEYAASVAAGVAAVVRQTGRFGERCPGSLVVMHGYSQVCVFLTPWFPRCLVCKGLTVGWDVVGGADYGRCVLWRAGWGECQLDGEVGFGGGGEEDGGYYHDGEPEACGWGGV